MAGLIGTTVSLETLGQSTPTSTPYITSFPNAAIVENPKIEYPDVESLFDPSTGVPPGFDRSLVNVAIDVGADYVTFDFDDVGTQFTTYATGYQNTYIFTFAGDDPVVIQSATIDESLTTLGLDPEDVTVEGNRLFINVESLPFNPETFVRIDLDFDAALAEWLSNPADISLVACTYQFFTGSVPTGGGFEYLIASAANPTDLNDPYYAPFNLENLFINFANNLGTAGAGAAGFAADYGALSFEQTIAKAYDEIIGIADAEGQGIDTDAAIQFFIGARGFYEGVAAERVVPSGVALGDALKIVAVGSILHEAIKAGIGRYADEVEALVADLAPDGQSSLLGQDLFAVA